MALLDEQPVGGTQTADGRFFVPKETQDQRLQVAINQVAALALLCRSAQPEDRLAFKRPIESTLEDIEWRISNHEGLIVLGGLKGQLQRLDEFKAEEVLFAVPSEKVTALEAV